MGPGREKRDKSGRRKELRPRSARKWKKLDVRNNPELWLDSSDLIPVKPSSHTDRKRSQISEQPKDALSQ